MMYSYGITQIGPYHVQKGTVCQDSHYIKKISPSLVIAAAADGLGSETHSDIASKIAAREAVEFCADNLPEVLSPEVCENLICRSFMHALQMITNEAARQNGDINQFDTTLCLCIFQEETVYFGQSGDSGAIVLCKDGHYEGITTQQRDEGGCVFPLAFGKEKWVFGTKEGVSSVLLATDGMLETFYPFLLHSEKVNIYIALAEFFMNGQALNFEELGEDGVLAKMDAFVKSIPEKQVNDDKTVVVIVNTAVECARMDEDYYKIPDWTALQKKRDEEFKRLAYPHLYAKENEVKKDSEENSSQSNENAEVIEDTNANETAEVKKDTEAAEDTGADKSEKAKEDSQNNESKQADNDNESKSEDTSGNKDTKENKGTEKQKSGGFLNKITSVFRSKSK